MSTLKPPKILLYPICLCLLLLSAADVVGADLSSTNDWQILETKHTKIHYPATKDLEQFNKMIDYSPASMGLKGLFSKPESDDPADTIKQKVDAIYERVQEILDMRKMMDKINVNIYPDKEGLHAAYYEIFQKTCQLRAWYIYKSNTIYINAADMSEGMLAHEMAHAIIDHFLSVRPPPATAEILARYVDGHLFN